MTAERFHHVDSRSDGMCGFWTSRDTQTGHEFTVHWSVTGKFTSQSEAQEEANRSLLELAKGGQP